MATDTIPARLFRQAELRPYAPAYYIRARDGWQATDWGTYARNVRSAARAFLAMGVTPSHGVCVLAANCPAWVIADLGAMCLGAPAAGIYTTCSATEVQYILHHAEARVAVVDTAVQIEKIRKIRAQCPELKYCVIAPGGPDVPSGEDDFFLSWNSFLARASESADEKLQQTLDALEPTGLATLIYTSGTTGPPKGVMLSHDNLAFTAEVARGLVDLSPNDCSLSYLPLSHIAEQMFTIHLPITVGSVVYFCEGFEKLADNLREVQPTMFMGVPRVWEKFYEGVRGKLEQATGVKKTLAAWARGVGRQHVAGIHSGAPMGAALKVQYALANRLVLSKIKQALGLARCRVAVVGAAPISREVLEFMASLDVSVHEVYGQSEDSGPTTFNPPGKTRLGTVGQKIEGISVRIAEDGEILVKGRNVFLGYFKEPTATRETMTDDGWLRSGDLGQFDSEGYLSITGRKKEILITSGGKNITPANIEMALLSCPLLAEAVVIGDGRKYLAALVTLRNDAAVQFASHNGHTGGPLHESPVLRAEIQKTVDEVNRTLARVETIKKFTILPRNFTIENGELTPTLKIKRKIVNKNFTAEIEQLYSE